MRESSPPLSLVVLLSLLALVSAGCGASEDQRTESIVIALENDIQTLDPAMLSDPHTSRVVWQMYEGLVWLDEGEPVPLIAESWEPSEDFTSWTFKIRPNVYFHKSGAFGTDDSTRTVTAKDVAYSYTRHAEGVGSFVFSGLVEGIDEYVSGDAESVSGFQAVDSLTFRVNLTRPDPSFIYRITSPYLGIMAREVVEENPEAFGQSISVGTGPFKLDGRTETEVRLEQNENYWRPTDGNLDKVTFRVEKNAQFRVTKFRNGNYDLLQLPTAFLPNFMSNDSLEERSDNYDTYKKTTYNAHFLGINNEKVQDVDLRRAISYAVDKRSIVQELYYGQAETATSPVLPGIQGYQPPEEISFDPDSARMALRQSSYDGRSLNILTSDAPNSEQIGQVVQSRLGEVGVETELERIDFNAMTSRIFGQEKPDLFVYFFEWVFSAPELLLNAYASSGIPSPNVFGYRNQRVDSLLNQIHEHSEREEINELARQAEQIALREAPVVWLFHQTNVYLMDPNLEGFRVNGHNYWDLAGVTLSE